MKKIKVLCLGLFIAVLIGCSSYDTADDFTLKNNEIVDLYNDAIDKLDFDKKGLTDKEFKEIEEKHAEYVKGIEELNLEEDFEKNKVKLLELYKQDITTLSEINKAVKKQDVDKYNNEIDKYNKNMNEQNKLSADIK